VQIGTGKLNASGVATFTTSSLKAGKHSITAAYAGDATCLAGDSAPLTQTVNSTPTLGAAVLPLTRFVS